ncbi:hypothetical protein [Mycobacterium marinum]|uniref:hypothetical protein n=1 Tax=Mycobacterium marinum TaxID=1781 RepID=UPI0035619320
MTNTVSVANTIDAPSQIDREYRCKSTCRKEQQFMHPTNPINSAMSVAPSVLITVAPEFVERAGHLDQEVLPWVPTNVCSDAASASFFRQSAAMTEALAALGHACSAQLRAYAELLRVAANSYATSDRRGASSQSR